MLQGVTSFICEEHDIIMGKSDKKLLDIAVQVVKFRLRFIRVREKKNGKNLLYYGEERFGEGFCF